MEREEEEEKIPHMCGSIGHRPLWGRCPAASLNYNRNLEGMDTADHLTLLRLLIFSPSPNSLISWLLSPVGKGEQCSFLYTPESIWRKEKTNAKTVNETDVFGCVCNACAKTAFLGWFRLIRFCTESNDQQTCFERLLHYSVASSICPSLSPSMSHI